MDGGATKFVKGGDAIAGIIITIINIVAGLTIGIVSKGMPFTEAMQKYTLLTVGDGLVSQIPALLISTATGLVVTRAASESNLGQDLIKQLFGNNSDLLYIIGGIVILLGTFTPPLPTFSYIILGLVFILLGYLMGKGASEQVEEPMEEISEAEELRRPENVLGLLK